MLQSMKELMAGIRSLNIGWQLWVMLMAAFNMLLPLFFIQQLEAQWTLAAFFAGATLGMGLVKIQGFTRLLGLMHIFWIPLLLWLWGRMSIWPVGEPFGIWLRTLMVINAVSIVIDAVDVVRYISGDRGGDKDS
jgi:hypothetical protein